MRVTRDENAQEQSRQEVLGDAWSQCDCVSILRQYISQEMIKTLNTLYKKIGNITLGSYKILKYSVIIAFVGLNRSTSHLVWV
jgi:hypothetical protein